jgi:hypothetical protein
MTTAESSGEPRIRDIIETHNQLALSYRQMLMVIQNQGFFFCFQQQAQPAQNAKRPNVVISILGRFLFSMNASIHIEFVQKKPISLDHSSNIS